MTKLLEHSLSWKLNDGSTIHAVGSNEGLYLFDRSTATVSEITPAGWTTQDKDAPAFAGFGYGPFGAGAFGTPRPVDEDSAGIFNWCFRNWGQNLLAGERGSPSILYEWAAPDKGTVAAAVANAPTGFDCFHVTDQRIIMMAGSVTEPRLVQWCDSENNTVWDDEVTNQAGSQTLAGAGRFKEIVTVQDQILLVSETDAYVCRYLGPPYVYGFDQIATGCGVRAGASVIVFENKAYWPGENDFFVFDGSKVTRLKCDVMDEIKLYFNNVNGGKVVGFANSAWAELWWLYQSGADEVDCYVAYDPHEKHWFTGTLDRSVGGGNSILGGPIMIGTDGYAYKHELEGMLPSDSDASEIFVESGPLEVAKGNVTQFIDSIQADLETSGSVNFYLFGRDRPQGPELEFGPYQFPVDVDSNQPVPARARGHFVRLKIEGVSSVWTGGITRLNFAKFGGQK